MSMKTFTTNEKISSFALAFNILMVIQIFRHSYLAFQMSSSSKGCYRKKGGIATLINDLHSNLSPYN